MIQSLYSYVDSYKLQQIVELCELDDVDWHSLDKISVNGKKLSEGQRQRIMIARALYNDSSLVILNDCFANIDNRRIKQMFNNLQSINKTIIVIVN